MKTFGALWKIEIASLFFVTTSEATQSHEIASQTKKRTRNDRPKGERRDCFAKRTNEARSDSWEARLLRKRNHDLAVTLLTGHCEGRSPEAIRRTFLCRFEQSEAISYSWTGVFEIASQTKKRARNDQPGGSLRGLSLSVTARSEATKRSRISTRWGEGRLLRWAKKRSSQ